MESVQRREAPGKTPHDLSLGENALAMHIINRLSSLRFLIRSYLLNDSDF